MLERLKRIGDAIIDFSDALEESMVESMMGKKLMCEGCGKVFRSTSRTEVVRKTHNHEVECWGKEGHKVEGDGG